MSRQGTISEQEKYLCSSRVDLNAIEQLEVLIDQLSQFGQPTTSLVLSIPLARRLLEKEAASHRS
jgi:hypothetical protein